MEMLSRKTAVVILLLHLLAGGSSLSAAEGIDFNRDVRPILSDKCFQCHGPDAKNQDSSLRLNTRELGLADLGGYAAIVPGDLDASELHRRIHESDLDSQMPPADSKLELSDRERGILDSWIRQGAEYDEHWSFKPVTRPLLPEVKDALWPRNQLDYFVLARLEAAGLEPAPVAERERLIRRVTLDLTGLPPTLEDVNNFLHDPAENAWEKVVDRLLASNTYGERMALVWLDAARYADSGGYQNDIKRTQWPWRDWVIRAYNQNLPFDEFTVQQLAGDLLDNATEEQRLATAFNRNHRINNEGGIIPEEFRVEYVADRVETTSTVWLGLTVGCARCHDHKYDPIEQRDFYQMSAFFNSVPENGRDGQLAPVPNMAVYTAGTRAQHNDLQQAVAAAQARLDAYSSQQAEAFTRWLKTATKTAEKSVLSGLPLATTHLTLDTSEDGTLVDARNSSHHPTVVAKKNEDVVVKTLDGRGLKIGSSSYVKAPQVHAEGFDAGDPQSWVLRFQPPPRFAGSEGPLLSFIDPTTQRGYRLMLQNEADAKLFRVSFQISCDAKNRKTLDVVSAPAIEPNQPVCLTVTYDGRNAAGVKIYVDGQPIATRVIRDDLAWTGRTTAELLVAARNEPDAKASNRDATLLNGILDDLQVYAVELSEAQVVELSAASPINVLLANYSTSARPAVLTHFLERVDTQHADQRLSVAEAQAELDRFEEQALTRVSIMEDMPESRPTYLLLRGVYDKPDKSEALKPATLGALPPMREGLPQNRLGLAQWLVDPGNPLTARVAVNRYWQMYFGRGLVATQDDFGSQGTHPTHPELLDWLAAEFVQSGWDIKAMQKKIVLSATYRQSSRLTPELLAADPANELLSRGPRFRLSGQTLRDQALAVSGLLSRAMGGPSVMPYQPAGLWDEVSAKGYKYIQAESEGLHRRSLYTFWRRTVPPPSMMNFDTSSREVCSVRFSRTNTPLQALNLMNDPQFVEAARCLAERMLQAGGPTAESRCRYGYRLVLAIEPSPETLGVLTGGYHRYHTRFSDQPSAAQSLISVGASEPKAELDATDLAAMTMVASILLNLDETVTKE